MKIIAPCTIKRKEVIDNAAKLLGCSSEDLQREILYRESVKKSERLPCKFVEATINRDALAKLLYNNLFTWIVLRLNEVTESKETDVKTIGVADLYGFESLETGGYEQLLINYVDDKLQKLYLSKVFDSEKALFKEEGLHELINSTTYLDKTTPIIELLENKAIGKPQGVFWKLESYKKNEDFMTLLGSMTKDYKDSKNYEKHKQRDKFMLKHTAKEITYSAKDFIDRNIDKVNIDVKDFIKDKLDPSISDILKVMSHYNINRQDWKWLEQVFG